MQGIGWEFVLGRAVRILAALFLVLLLFAFSPWLLSAVVLLAGGLIAAAVAASPREYRAWFLYVAAFIGFTMFRTIVDEAGFPVQFAYAIDLDRILGLGTLPTVALQSWLRSDFLDYASVTLHLSWFVVPPLVPLLLWLSKKNLERFAVAGFYLFAISILIHLLVPTAPPWIAAAMGMTEPVTRVLHEVLAPLAPGITEAGYHASANDVAAMPSLHMALTVLCALAIGDARRHWTVPMAAYSLLMGFEIVYSGEHYVVDALVGAGIALAAWRLARWGAGGGPQPTPSVARVSQNRPRR